MSDEALKEELLALPCIVKISDNITGIRLVGEQRFDMKLFNQRPVETFILAHKRLEKEILEAMRKKYDLIRRIQFQHANES